MSKNCLKLSLINLQLTSLCKKKKNCQRDSRACVLQCNYKNCTCNQGCPDVHTCGLGLQAVVMIVLGTYSYCIFKFTGCYFILTDFFREFILYYLSMICDFIDFVFYTPVKS